jgi:hypothetical protein
MKLNQKKIRWILQEKKKGESSGVIAKINTSPEDELIRSGSDIEIPRRFQLLGGIWDGRRNQLPMKNQRSSREPIRDSNSGPECSK